VHDVCQVGDVMQVKVIAIDEQDRVKLSRRAVLIEFEEEIEESGAGRD
jgi:polyribonucleotide nucleotidyltransferase